MDEPVDKLLEELANAEEAARQAAIVRARALPPDGLQQLVDRYHLCRISWIQQVHPAPLQKPMQERIKELICGRSPKIPQSNTPELLQLTPRLNLSLAAVVAALDNPRCTGPILTLLAGRSILGMDRQIYREGWNVFENRLPQLYPEVAIQKLPVYRAILVTHREVLEQGWITLERLLPRLQPQDTEGWTTEQRKALVTPLVSAYDYYAPMPCRDGRSAQSLGYNMQRARIYIPIRRPVSVLKRMLAESRIVLKALQQIGDERELALVRRLVSLKPRTPMSREIQQAAEECLPFVEIRAQANRQAKTLLRPINTDAGMAPDTLLRPASSSASDPDPAEPLRPFD